MRFLATALILNLFATGAYGQGDILASKVPHPKVTGTWEWKSVSYSEEDRLQVVPISTARFPEISKHLRDMKIVIGGGYVIFALGVAPEVQRKHNLNPKWIPYPFVKTYDQAPNGEYVLKIEDGKGGVREKRFRYKPQHGVYFADGLDFYTFWGGPPTAGYWAVVLDGDELVVCYAAGDENAGPRFNIPPTDDDIVRHKMTVYRFSNRKDDLADLFPEDLIETWKSDETWRNGFKAFMGANK